MKPSLVFSCAKCGAQFSKWAGRCTECGAWGTVAEEPSSGQQPATNVSATKPGKIQPFAGLEAKAGGGSRLKTSYGPWDELTGGLVPGSVTLFGGEPGVGKSTLLSQLALALAHAGKRVLFVTGEESPSQVLLRLVRIGGKPHASLSFLDTTDAAVIAATLAAEKPELMIVDSIQSCTLENVGGESGSPTQVKALAATIAAAAKMSGSPVVLVGQVTKEGDLAGPRQLEHLVDTVIMLEGDRSQAFRFLRVLKHRFGETAESALLRLGASGLEEVLDPSSALIAERPSGVPGTAIVCLLDGRRPLLVELQALVTPAGYGTPLRRVSGLDGNRVSLLLAVMARRASTPFGDQDVFMNVVGGLKFQEPAADLAACLALASAKRDVALPERLVAIGEVGLAGELRAAPRLELRLKEAKRLGFNQAMVPWQKELPKVEGIELLTCKTLKDAIRHISPQPSP